MRPAPIQNKGSFSNVAYGCYRTVVDLRVGQLVKGSPLSKVDAGVNDPIWDEVWEVTTPISEYVLGSYAND